MAEPGATADDEDYDVKDEELVDFEGSDYGFDSADEEEQQVEDQAAIAVAASPARRHVKLNDEGEEHEQVPPLAPPSPSPPPVPFSRAPTPAPASGDGSGIADAIASAEAAAEAPPATVVVDDPPSSKFDELFPRPKPDLEDGELDDAAMPEGSDPEAVANGGDDYEGENDRRERKRRKDRYAAERQLDNKGRRDAEETALAHNRQFRARGSDKMHGSQRNNYSRGFKSANGASFQRANFGPGIMGPGRPPVAMEYGGHVSVRSMDRGYLRPVGGIVPPGRLNQNDVNMQNRIRDSMAVQEHILRQQQLLQMTQEQVQQVQAQAQAQAQVQARAQAHAHAQVQQAHAHAHANAHAHAHAHAYAHAQAQVHMANSGALRASAMRPTMGLELIQGQMLASHGRMHVLVQKSDPGPQINFPRPLEGFGARAPPSTAFAAGRGGSVGGQLVLNQSSSRDQTAAGRQQLNGWSPASVVHHEISNSPGARGRAQGQDRGQVETPLWGEQHMGGILTGFPSPLGVIGHAVPVNGVAPAGVVALGTPKRQGSLPMMIPNNAAPTNRENASMKKADIRPQVDGTRRTNEGNRGSLHLNGNQAHYSRNDSGGLWSRSSPGIQSGNKRSRENGTDRRHSSSKPVSRANADNGTGTAGNNLIKLGGPVIKSRVLSLSGFPENTSMAVVVEAFEKQGKILDFKKDENGNAFHITFSSVAEAVAAKRSLHRTLLNGRQITVDYSVQGH